MKIIDKNESGIIMRELAKIPTNETFNKNVLIVGTSGSGKTYLGKALREERKPEFTFIYKEDGNYQDTIKVRNHRKNITPDLNKTGFIDSFIETQNLSEIGIMGSSLTTALYSVYGDGNLEDMKNKIRVESLKNNSMERSIYNYLSGKLNLYYPEEEESMEGTKIRQKQITGEIARNNEIEEITINKEKKVISFTGMTQEEQIFFSDYILRILMGIQTKDTEQEGTQGIMIDEIHRLKNLNAGIISEIVREIRYRGYIIGITQSLSDLPDDLINNFGTIFQFQSKHFKDLEKLRLIHERLPETVMNLEPHEFIEVNRYNRERRQGYVSLYEVVQ